jgi:transcriptional regulator with XRE-family HTH domain
VTDISTFGDVIHDLREARGMSQSKLADKAGVTQSYVSMIESRQRGWRPSRNVVRAFATGLGVKERELLEAAGMDGYEDIEPPLSVKEAIDADPYLAPREKRALTELYRAMVWGRR